MKEEWRPIEGFEGQYEVSNTGKIRSIDRKVYQQGKFVSYGGTEMKPYHNNRGYQMIALSKGNKKKRLLVHRLVAIAFIPNIDNLPCINHKDENKDNNNVNNLEWCNHKYNCNYGTHMERVAQKQSIGVVMYTLNGERLRVYKSSKEAERETGIPHSGIMRCCKGLQNSCCGYTWTYSDSERTPVFTPVGNAKKIVCQYDMNMNLVGTYDSTRKAEEATGVVHNNISACCRNKQATAGGFIWKYID